MKVEQRIIDFGPDLTSEFSNSSKPVGGFVVEDIHGLNSELGLGIHGINLLTVENYVLEDLINKIGEVSSNEHVLDVIIVNLNNEECADQIDEIADLISDQGFEEITDWTGYDTRLAFISSEKACGKVILDYIRALK